MYLVVLLGKIVFCAIANACFAVVFDRWQVIAELLAAALLQRKISHLVLETYI